MLNPLRFKKSQFLSFLKEIGRAFDDLFLPKTKYIIRLDENNFNILRGVMRGEFPASYAEWMEVVFNQELRTLSLRVRAVYCNVNAFRFISYCNNNNRVPNMDSLLESPYPAKAGSPTIG